MSSQPGHPAPRITLKRTYDASIAEVWDMWTTKDGIESWWGPTGFRVEVRRIDVRVGGELLYAMIADAAEMKAFMKANNMPNETESLITYREVIASNRLAYHHSVDFVPGVAPYAVFTEVGFEAVGESVQLSVTIDRMHDELWTNRAVQGWELELGKLTDALKKRR
jgi:uncharacterized protein YndB with AHSA1/START domain